MSFEVSIRPFYCKITSGKEWYANATIIQSWPNARSRIRASPIIHFRCSSPGSRNNSQDGAFTNGLSVMVDVPKCQSHIPMQDIIEKFLMESEAKNI